LLYSRGDNNGFATWALPLQGERKPFLVVPRGLNGRLSPDGRWLANQSAESGNHRGIGRCLWRWPRKVAGLGQYRKYSTVKQGRQSTVLSGRRFHRFTAVPVKEVAGALQFGTPQTLVTQWSVVGEAFFDVVPDGKKILLDRIAQRQPIRHRCDQLHGRIEKVNLGGCSPSRNSHPEHLETTLPLPLPHGFAHTTSQNRSTVLTVRAESFILHFLSHW
jgi:hypothetical protein